VFLFDIVDDGGDRIMMDVERIKNIFFTEADFEIFLLFLWLFLMIEF
jgi:hypothetical protein